MSAAPTNGRTLRPACDYGDSAATGGPLPMIAATLQTYLTARQAQRRDHSDVTLCHARTEAHDELLWALRMRGVAFAGREDGVRVAMGLTFTAG